MIRLTTCAASDGSPEAKRISMTFELRIGVTFRRLPMRMARELIASRSSAALAMFDDVAAGARQGQTAHHLLEQLAALDEVGLGVDHRLVELEQCQAVRVGRLNDRVGAVAGDHDLALGRVLRTARQHGEQAGEGHDRKQAGDQPPALEHDVQDLEELLLGTGALRLVGSGPPPGPCPLPLPLPPCHCRCRPRPLAMAVAVSGRP